MAVSAVSGTGKDGRVTKGDVLATVASGVAAGSCLLYTSDAADERSSVDLGGRRIIKKKNKENMNTQQTTYQRTKDDDRQEQQNDETERSENTDI